MTQRDDLLIWIDLEMTGLDPETCAVIELAMIVTDRQLDQIGQPLELTIWQPDAVLDRMSPFVRQMHTHSGLLERARRSECDLQDAERQVMDIVVPQATYRTARLAGNSVWQDRRFLMKYMPSLEAHLHYRIIDVSSVKELAEAWYGERYEKPKDGKHTALFDIRQSIEELKFYRQTIMR